MAASANYQGKLCSIPEAVSLVHSGQTLAIAIAGSEPVGLLQEMANQAERLENVTTWTCLPMRAYDIFMQPQMQGRFFNENWFYGAPDRKVHPEGRVSYTPNNLHRASKDKLRSRHGKLDLFMGTATPPDAEGNVSLSLGLVIEREMIEAADRVILELNENLPWTGGETVINLKDVDAVVENHLPLVEIPNEAPQEIEEQIGSHIASLIEDGATIQLGIGGIPNAIAAFLHDRKDLGVHTELLVDGIMELVEAGVITNRRKTLHPGKLVAAFALGTQKLYRYMHRNPNLAIMRGSYVNNPAVIAQNYKMVSVNTAIQVDILGQVCSQSLGPRQFSGTGGQLDTHRGAQMSDGGRGIIALRSTAKNGSISTIVPTLAPGSGVTVPSQDVDTIVTEYGIAELRGLSVKKRMEALVRIAHPDFREQIVQEAHHLGIVP
ncbi:MAG: acetyl-CoA hydrolase/transferase C-terminal domain-containing protein [Anaerolineaceae bacterium]|nr:acetyl-CoA hydrolase/transferase C-terminal domain-containing protein [Anaerolineaceae bacterium]